MGYQEVREAILQGEEGEVVEVFNELLESLGEARAAISLRGRSEQPVWATVSPG